MRLEYFEMIDRVETLRIDEAVIVARARVPSQSPVFEGHFPGHSLMPGVLLIETMAQASGFLILALNEFRLMPFLASVKEAKMHSFVGPGAELSVEASLDHDGSGFAVTRAEIRHDGKRMCNTRLMLRTMPFPTPELERHMRARAQDIGLVRSDG